MQPTPPRDRVFISYSHEDGKHLKRLKTHLAVFERQGLIVSWDDTMLTPGAKWEEEIKKALARAKVAILLVSADFLASAYISANELPPLLAAAENDGARIFIVIIKPCAFEDTELAQYQAVNRPSRPVEALGSVGRDGVWTNVARLVKEALTTEPPRQIEAPSHDGGLLPVPVAATEAGASDKEDSGKADAYLNALRTDASTSSEEANLESESVDDLIARGRALNKRNQYDRALQVLERATQLAPTRSDAWHYLGGAFAGLERWEDALRAWDRAVVIDPNRADTEYYRAYVLSILNRIGEALEAASRAVELAPQDAENWRMMSSIQIGMGMSTEALESSERAIQLAPSSSRGFATKAFVLRLLGRLPEALAVVDTGLVFDKHSVFALYIKETILRALDRTAEADEIAQKIKQIKEREQSSLLGKSNDEGTES